MFRITDPLLYTQNIHSKLYNCLVLIVYHSTNNNKLSVSSGWINAWMGTSNHRMSHNFKSPGTVANGLTGIKIELVKCLFILNGAEYSSSLKSPHKYERKWIRQDECKHKQLFSALAIHLSWRYYWVNWHRTYNTCPKTIVRELCSYWKQYIF